MKPEIVSFNSYPAQKYVALVQGLPTTHQHTYFIETYGCQMNVNDSQKYAGMLLEMGYIPTQDKTEADLILFNTCCVRENAELRLQGNLGKLKELKDKNKNLIICVCGCMMQQEGVAQSIKKRFGFVDIVLGSCNAVLLPQFVYQVRTKGTACIDVDTDKELIVEDVPVKRDFGFTAWITVMYGCNNFCSYCIVPYVRGRERSRRSADIIAEAKQLAQDGCKEITLLGQNVNSYGKDCNEITFASLLRELDKIDGIERIRFMTSHPKDCSDELIDAIAECRHVCCQLHLPVQSGSDEILRRMNRRYTRADYLALVKKAKERVPGIEITTDIIVGFPGETEEDFLQTVSLYREAEFANAYMFIYSRRSGTPAAKEENQVPLAVKKERLARLIEVQAEYTTLFNKRYIGGTYPVLAESVSKRSNRMISGRTESGRMVSFTGDADMVGKIVNVKIKEAKVNTLLGEITD